MNFRSRINEAEEIANEFIQYARNVLGIDFRNVEEVRAKMEQIGNLLVEFLKNKFGGDFRFEIVTNYQSRFHFKRLKKAIRLYEVIKVNDKEVTIVYGYIPASDFKKRLVWTIQDIKYDRENPIRFSEDTLRDIKKSIAERLKNCGINYIEIEIADEGAELIVNPIPESLSDEQEALILALYHLLSNIDLVEKNYPDNYEVYNVEGLKITVYYP